MQQERRTRGSDSETESRSGRPLRFGAAQNAQHNNGGEPRQRIVRNEQGEIVEYRHDDGESYKGKKSHFSLFLN